ncbi:MAG TPA: DUF4328 domain-containing protein [Allosphingosinicella sp.]|jgi:hypothetical protein
MYEFRDSSRLTRAVVAAAWLGIVFNFLHAAVHFLDPPPGGPHDLMVFPRLLGMVGFVLLGGLWIYRANANVHALGGNVSRGPGWTVGSFLVPLANLIIPYRAMRETWEASHEAGGLDGEAGLSLLRLWWGLWLSLAGVSALWLIVGDAMQDSPRVEPYVTLLRAVIQTAFCLVFIRLMRGLARTQLLAFRQAPPA